MSRYFQHPDSYRQRKRGDKAWFGIAVVLAGVFLMLKKLGIFIISWHTFWPVILIAVGLLIGLKKRFRNHAWWILILIGGAHLVPEFDVMNGVSSTSLVVPLALIIGGTLIAVRSRSNARHCKPNHMQVVTNTDSSMDIDITFGGRKELITSKDFRGGRISATFGGVEVNMVQADSTVQEMVIDIKVSFGGIELVVPSHWDVKNEIESTMGSVEDIRAVRTAPTTNEERKLLILRGSCTCGSIEVKSY